ncbi:thioesterase family protein [Nocardioides yefusunii]|uniref:Thioesterase family protein n=1 Tax=Nocardioides yefusunii TaxID=2500546 RepID=A0ABW1QWD7_9ACTN|nr:thioesterase family protein [Nocardioides yefusunii]
MDERVSRWAAAVRSTSVAEGIHAVDLDGGWSVGGGINGGFQMAVVGQALASAVPGKPHPVTFAAHFLSAATGGPALVRTTVRREGGRFATLSADLVQDDVVRLTVTATYSDLALLPDTVATTAAPFAMAPLEECVSTSFAPPELKKVAPLMERFDMRFDPSSIGWAVGEPSGAGELRAWFRVEEGQAPDPVQLLLAVDALPPVTFDLGLPGWAPTVQLTAHVRAVPADGWLRLRQVTRNVAGGLFEEDCEVWDSADRLVAQSRQLAVLPR